MNSTWLTQSHTYIIVNSVKIQGAGHCAIGDHLRVEDLEGVLFEGSRISGPDHKNEVRSGAEGYREESLIEKLYH